MTFLALPILQSAFKEGLKLLRSQKLLAVSAFLGMALVPMADMASDLSLTGEIPMEMRAAETVPAFHPEPVVIGEVAYHDAPKFSEIKHTPSRKQAFYDYLLPMVRQANLEVALERRWLESLANQLVEGNELDQIQREDLKKMERRYALREKSDDDVIRVGALLQRVDVVPASLVIAQAAKETGWGRSRFAREANNYFGLWCFYRGCGVTPKRRDQGRSHEVATFESVEQSVRYYVRTLNTHNAYAHFRQLRSEGKHTDRPGEQLAVGLLRYSERGEAYVEEIQAMIRYNELQRFNQVDSA